jgi:hypothetical protein
VRHHRHGYSSCHHGFSLAKIPNHQTSCRHGSPGRRLRPLSRTPAVRHCSASAATPCSSLCAPAFFTNASRWPRAPPSTTSETPPLYTADSAPLPAAHTRIALFRLADIDLIQLLLLSSDSCRGQLHRS